MTETPRPRFSFRDIIAQIRRRPGWPGRPPIIVRPVDRPSQEIDTERLRTQVASSGEAFRKVGGVGAAWPEARAAPRDDETGSSCTARGTSSSGKQRGLDGTRQFLRDPDRRRRLQRRARAKGTAGARRVWCWSRCRRAPTTPTPSLTTLKEVDGRSRRERTARRLVAHRTTSSTSPATGVSVPATEPEEPPRAPPVPPETSDKTRRRRAGVGRRHRLVDGRATKPTPTGSPASPADQEDVRTVDPNDDPRVRRTRHVRRRRRPVPRARRRGSRSRASLPRAERTTSPRSASSSIKRCSTRTSPQLISISAGTHTRNNLGLLGFEILAANYGLIDGARASGRRGRGQRQSDEEFYPAAFPWVIGVGSVDARRQACRTTPTRASGWTSTRAAATWSTRSRSARTPATSRRTRAEVALQRAGAVERHVVRHAHRQRRHRSQMSATGSRRARRGACDAIVERRNRCTDATGRRRASPRRRHSSQLDPCSDRAQGVVSDHPAARTTNRTGPGPTPSNRKKPEASTSAAVVGARALEGDHGGAGPRPRRRPRRVGRRRRPRSRG